MLGFLLYFLGGLAIPTFLTFLVAVGIRQLLVSPELRILILFLLNPFAVYLGVLVTARYLNARFVIENVRQVAGLGALIMAGITIGLSLLSVLLLRGAGVQIPKIAWELIIQGVCIAVLYVAAVYEIKETS